MTAPALNQSPKSIVSGPKGNLLLGSLRPFSRDPLAFFTEIMAKYGEIVHFKLGPYPVYLISNPAMLYEMFVEKVDMLHKDSVTKGVMAKTMGNGILLSDGDFWRKNRRLMQPAFHHKRIETYANIAVEQAHKALASWQDGQEIEIREAFNKITLGIVAKTLFDVEAGSAATVITESIGVLQEIATQRFQAVIPVPDWMPTPVRVRQKKLSEKVQQAVMNLIAERRQRNQDRGDLLSMLLNATDENGVGLSDIELRDEIVTLFLAGYDTTALTLSWARYLLAQNPQAEAALYHEVDTVLAGKAPTFEDLKRLPYTNQVVKETLRLYPPAWFNSRQPIAPITLGGHQIPKGALIMSCIYSMHRHPNYWEDPNAFKPERFAEAAGLEKSLPKFTYYPFGGGQRICIGQQFALMEIPLVLATLVQGGYFKLVDPALKVTPKPEITLSPCEPMMVRFTRR
jgi:cytochrome P450